MPLVFADDILFYVEVVYIFLTSASLTETVSIQLTVEHKHTRSVFFPSVLVLRVQLRPLKLLFCSPDHVPACILCIHSCME